MDLESRQSVEAGIFTARHFFNFHLFSARRKFIFNCKKNKKAKERLKTNVKSRMDSELSKRFSANEETIYYDHYSSFAPRAIFLGGGERGQGGMFYLSFVGGQ